MLPGGSLQRGVFLASLFMFAVGLLLAATLGKAPVPVQERPTVDAKTSSVPMLGGSPSRDMVNLVDKDVLDDFAVRPKGKEKNVKWAANLGSKAYGGPVIAGGRIFVGTNNDNPRDPKIKGDKGVVMCFRESDGKFLWQIVHDKLPAEAANDWPPRASPRRRASTAIGSTTSATAANWSAHVPATRRPARARSSGPTT